ncbi:hypothetical protein Goklo_016968 [Gossypium klotzschianum]|uniref:Cytochrome b5 heme-binding domain-containing protein n=1 Tax=Gossypium klotzschianum TaxID=34286 RepID=A0A7J8UGJ9_9ROSI|nr:hypothetical protein [Gossypium klotzschianum]
MPQKLYISGTSTKIPQKVRAIAAFMTKTPQKGQALVALLEKRRTKAKAFSPFSSGEELDPKVHTFNPNKTKDCWLIIFGKVCDVTPFMDIDHPEGGEVLLSATGKDVTNDFEDVGHSD